MRSFFPYNLRASFGRRVIPGISRLDRYRAAILGHYETCQTLSRYRVSKFVGTPRPLREVVSQTKFGCKVGHFGQKDEPFLLVNTHEQRIETACTGMYPPMTNSCSRSVRSLIHAPDRSPGS
jgi:hypothetical protein